MCPRLPTACCPLLVRRPGKDARSRAVGALSGAAGPAVPPQGQVAVARRHGRRQVSAWLQWLQRLLLHARAHQSVRVRRPFFACGLPVTVSLLFRLSRSVPPGLSLIHSARSVIYCVCFLVRLAFHALTLALPRVPQRAAVRADVRRSGGRARDRPQRARSQVRARARLLTHAGPTRARDTPHFVEDECLAKSRALGHRAPWGAPSTATSLTALLHTRAGRAYNAPVRAGVTWARRCCVGGWSPCRRSSSSSTDSGPRRCGTRARRHSYLTCHIHLTSVLVTG